MRFLKILVIIFLFSSAYAASDLLQVYNQALVSDQLFQSAKEQYWAATEAYPQARAVLLPNISLTADADHTTETFFGFEDSLIRNKFSFNTLEYTLNVTQPVIDFGKWHNLHLADYQVKQASATFTSAAQSLLLRTAQAYFNVLLAEDTLIYTQAEKRANERQLDQAKQRFNVGLDAITSVYNAQASYDATYAQEIAAKDAVINNKEQLRQITDVYYDNIATLKTKMPLLTPKPQNVETWVNKANNFNFDLQAARFAVDAARANIHVQFSGHLPVLNAVGSYNRFKNYGRSGSTLGNNTQTTFGGLQLSVPIFQGGLVVSKTRQAEDQYGNAVAQMIQTQRQVSVQLRQTYNSILDGISKIKADRQAVLSGEASVESTEASVKAGTRTIVDLLLVQQQLFQAQTTLAQDQFTYINNTLQFKQLAGTLNYRDIIAINTWLNGTSKTKRPANVYNIHVNGQQLVINARERLPK